MNQLKINLSESKSNKTHYFHQRVLRSLSHCRPSQWSWSPLWRRTGWPVPEPWQWHGLVSGGGKDIEVNYNWTCAGIAVLHLNTRAEIYMWRNKICKCKMKQVGSWLVHCVFAQAAQIWWSQWVSCIHVTFWRHAWTDTWQWTRRKTASHVHRWHQSTEMLTLSSYASWVLVLH